MKKKKRRTSVKDSAWLNKDRNLTIHQYTDPTICLKCGALYNRGQWTWDDLPNEANEAICPACQRIADNHPAGYVELKGSFFEQHEEEILNLIRNIGLIEQFRHPLERIISIDPIEDHTLVTTTGMHIAKSLGEALKNSYQGEIKCLYNSENYILVFWHR